MKHLCHLPRNGTKAPTIPARTPQIEQANGRTKVKIIRITNPQMPILIQRVVLGDTPMASVIGIGARNSSGTTTVLPQYSHFISAAAPCGLSAEPHDGQLNNFASAIFSLLPRANQFVLLYYLRLAPSSPLRSESPRDSILWYNLTSTASSRLGWLVG